MAPNARNQYLKTQIETASKEQLVVMLFDGIIRFTERAKKAMIAQQIEDSHHALMRAQAIIMELICTIDKDKGGEVANNMMSLHAYAFNCLIVANMKKDVAKIDEVQKIYRELREAWTGAMDSLGISSNAGKPLPAAVPAPAKTAIPGAPAKAAAAPAAPVPAPAKPAGAGNAMAATAIPAPAAPKTAGYGMGRTAGIGALKPTGASATPHMVASAGGLRPASMLNAYSAANRSIA